MMDSSNDPKIPQTLNNSLSSSPQTTNADPRTAQVPPFSIPNSSVGGVTPNVFGPPVGLALHVGQQQVTHWQGPYPPPDALERYEQIHPGTFDRMLSMAERMEAAQISQSQLALHFQHKDTSRGQWLAFLLSGFAMGAAVLMAYIGQPWLAGAFISMPVLGVAKALAETAMTKSKSPTTNP